MSRDRLLYAKHWTVIALTRCRAGLRKARKLYWGDFRRDQRALLCVLFGCILLVFGTLLAGFVPFAPLTIHGYGIKPLAACPGEEVTTLVDYEVEEPFLGSVGMANVSTKWRASDGRLTPTVDEPIDLAPTPRRTVESPVKRIAPRDSGRWAIETTVTVRGRVMGLGRTDVVRVQSEPLMKVSACTPNGTPNG